jgi:hypothetical protein
MVLPRLGPFVIIIGAIVMGSALSVIVWEIRAGIDLLVSYIVTMGFMGLGCGMILGSITPITLSEVDTDYAGAASGTLRSLQEFGGASGVAVIGGMFLSVGIPGDPATWRDAFMWSSAITLLVLLIIAVIALTVPRDLQVFESD